MFCFKDKLKINICQIKLRNLSFVVLIIIIFLSFQVFEVRGDLIDELNQQIKEKEQKRKELEEKSKKYQQVINRKQNEIQSLETQIAIFNARIGKLETEIDLTEGDISQVKLEILRLEEGIDDAAAGIKGQKENLIQIIQSIEEYDRATEMEIMLKSENFSDFFNQLAYLEKLQQGVQKKVERLKELKLNLHNNKKEKEEKKASLEDLKNQLKNQKKSLAYQKQSRKNLLTYTKGEEEKYQQMLANIRAQKQELLGDLNELREQKADELARLERLQEKPLKEYWASSAWYYAQDDPRWGNVNIGMSDSKMKNYGCAITSVAMVFSYNGSWITPAQLAKKSIYYWDLIVWPRKWGSITCENCPPPHKSVFDWGELDSQLDAGHPVIVFIKADGYGSAGHYVVVHHKTEGGRYVVHDPMFGSNIYLSSTRAYLSELYETSTSLDQMVIYH